VPLDLALGVPPGTELEASPRLTVGPIQCSNVGSTLGTTVEEPAGTPFGSAFGAPECTWVGELLVAPLGTEPEQWIGALLGSTAVPSE